MKQDMDTLSRKLEMKSRNHIRPPGYTPPPHHHHLPPGSACLRAAFPPPPLSSHVQGPQVSPAPSPQLTRPGTPGVARSKPSAHASRDPRCPLLQALSSHVQGPWVSPAPRPQVTRPRTPGVPCPEPSGHVSRDPGCPPPRAAQAHTSLPQVGADLQDGPSQGAPEPTRQKAMGRLEAEAAEGRVSASQKCAQASPGLVARPSFQRL